LNYTYFNNALARTMTSAPAEPMTIVSLMLNTLKAAKVEIYPKE